MPDTAQKATSDAKLCVGCGAAFDDGDDRRYNQCSTCRNPSEVEAIVTGTATIQPGVTVMPEDGIEPLSISVEKRKPPPPENRDYYWLGVTDDAPWSYVTAGGVQFQRTHGQVIDSPDGKGQIHRDHVGRGCIHWLTKDHVKYILDEVAQKVVRDYQVRERKQLNGDITRHPSGSIKSMKPHPSHPFVPKETDRPLGEFIYMVRVRHKNDLSPMDNPPTLVPR